MNFGTQKVKNMSSRSLSVGEQICSDFGQYLRDLEQEGRCLFLPFQIQNLKVKSIGKFTERTFEFDRGLTVFYGYNGTGKTTLVKAIASVSGDHTLLKSGQNDGEIELMLSDGRMLHQDLFEPRRVQCVVLDEAGERLDINHYEMLLHYLRSLDVQLIVMIGRTDKDLYEWIIRSFPDCRFINLN
jgi:hypothetical protein